MPETGTFLSVDHVESEPPYQYVGGNVVNRVDPSGMRPDCPTGTCGPDITRWLMGEMKRHYTYGREIFNQEESHIRFVATFSSKPTSYIPLGSVPLLTPFREIVDSFGIGYLPANYETMELFHLLEFALYGLAVDYANVDYGTVHGCSKGNCAFGRILPKHTPITLCGKCVDSSDIGNIMFGLGGAARELNLATTYVSATGYNFLTGGAIFGPDGRGAISGYLIGKSEAYVSELSLCGMLRTTNFIGYNEEPELHGYCKACKIEGTGPKAYEESSLYRVSNGHSTINDLKRIVGNKIKLLIPGAN